MKGFIITFIALCLSLSLVQYSIAQICGRRKTSRIVNGVFTNVNEFPMMVGIVQKPSPYVFCGGTILTNNYVLTSAHCLIGRSPVYLVILVGDHDYSRGNDTPYSKVYNVRNYIIHPSYNQNTYANDIAIITASPSIVYNLGVGPVCLPPTNLLYTNSIVEAAGWGSVGSGDPVSTTLRKVPLTVVSNSACSQYYSVQTTQICTYTKNRDTCQYDSGGPLFYMLNGRVTIVGIVSYGTGCATVFPSVSTRVSSYLSWIKANAPGSV